MAGKIRGYRGLAQLSGLREGTLRARAMNGVLPLNPEWGRGVLLFSREEFEAWAATGFATPGRRKSQGSVRSVRASTDLT